jgi:hypothetical protein
VVLNAPSEEEMDRIEEKNSCTVVMFNLINKNGEKIISLGGGEGGGEAGNCIRKQGEINLSLPEV